MAKVIGVCQDRHRNREFISFLIHLERNVPADQEMHLIMDNYCTDKSAQVQRRLRLQKRTRFLFHFTPTSTPVPRTWPPYPSARILQVLNETKGIFGGERRGRPFSRKRTTFQSRMRKYDLSRHFC